MFVSASIIGLNEKTTQLASELKSHEGYGIDFRIQCIQVESIKAHSELVAYRMYQVVGREAPEIMAALKDNTYEIDHMMIPIGDDVEWLKESDGHDTIILSEVPAGWESAVEHLKAKGYWFIDLSSTTVEDATKDILGELEVRRKRGNGSSV